MAARLDLAVSKGCDGVEPDNVDAYSNSNGLGLTASDQISFNTFIAQQVRRSSIFLTWQVTHKAFPGSSTWSFRRT